MKKRCHLIFCIVPLLFACGDETPTNASRAEDDPTASIEDETVSDKGPIFDGAGEIVDGDLATDTLAEEVAVPPSLLPTPAGNGAPSLALISISNNFPTIPSFQVDRAKVAFRR
jgi:hypothetical protein